MRQYSEMFGYVWAIHCSAGLVSVYVCVFWAYSAYEPTHSSLAHGVALLKGFCDISGTLDLAASGDWNNRDPVIHCILRHTDTHTHLPVKKASSTTSQMSEELGFSTNTRSSLPTLWSLIAVEKDKEVIISALSLSSLLFVFLVFYICFIPSNQHKCCKNSQASQLCHQ